jgi:hypothetical protein
MGDVTGIASINDAPDLLVYCSALQGRRLEIAEPFRLV